MDKYTRKKLRAYAKFLVRKENRNPYISEHLLTSKQIYKRQQKYQKKLFADYEKTGKMPKFDPVFEVNWIDNQVN